MKRIAVLGPKGTYTDIAAKTYLTAMNMEGEHHYCSTMRKTFAAVGTVCDYGVIPIENTLDGFVQIILDLLSTTEMKVIHELVLPIRFAFVANCEAIEDVKQVYVQFKSANQCTEFLEQFAEDQIITTASNSQSYEQFLRGKPFSGAVIPIHMLEYAAESPLLIEEVADTAENHTRFIVIAKDLNSEVEANHQWKTSFVIWGDQDRPGLLVDILTLLTENGVNMKSIMSRPTKSGLGNYNFFIDIDGCYQKDPKVREAFVHVMDRYNIKILGSYYRVDI